MSLKGKEVIKHPEDFETLFSRAVNVVDENQLRKGNQYKIGSKEKEGKDREINTRLVKVSLPFLSFPYIFLQIKHNIKGRIFPCQQVTEEFLTNQVQLVAWSSLLQTRVINPQHLKVGLGSTARAGSY
uniref:Uncharacterized protein n=1 Tax=Nelumbo nucifera TaxID=4432 RepID=A0A822ZNF0_NELNU|nr:TPA_asm: hypothetical protein HUJ06_017461 [Nelumbo nucifera]